MASFQSDTEEQESGFQLVAVSDDTLSFRLKECKVDALLPELAERLNKFLWDQKKVPESTSSKPSSPPAPETLTSSLSVLAITPASPILYANMVIEKNDGVSISYVMNFIFCLKEAAQLHALKIKIKSNLESVSNEEMKQIVAFLTPYPFQRLDLSDFSFTTSQAKELAMGMRKASLSNKSLVLPKAIQKALPELAAFSRVTFA